MKRVLLTGAGGFVGHHTLEHLLVNTDWEIVCIDSFRHRGKTSRIREVLDGLDFEVSLEGRKFGSHWTGPRVKVFTHDLRAPIDSQLDAEIGHIDYVISMASDSHVDRSCVEPRPFIENNVSLVLTLLEWARGRLEANALPSPAKFIHVSTDEVYGPAPVGHDHVEGEPHRPSNPYSASKACQEDICYSYWRTFDLPIMVTNTMNIIGERQDPEKFVPKVLSKVLAGETVQIHAEPEAMEDYGRKVGSRFYLHARNQADALLYLLQKMPVNRYTTGMAPTGMRIHAPLHMPRFNVVGEREIDNLEMATLIAEYAGKPLKYELVDFHTSRPGHDLRYALDGSLIATIGSGWKPPVPLAASLQKTVEWSLDHPEWLLP